MQIPSLGELLPSGAAVTAIVPRTGGRLSVVNEVRLADDTALIVKQYADEWRWKQAKEIYVYRLLARHRIGPVPQVVHVDLERAATVLTRLPGGPLSEAALGPAALHAAYRQIGRFLAALHRITMSAYGYLTTTIVDPLPDNTAYMRRQFAKKLDEFAALGGPGDVHEAVRIRVGQAESLFATSTRPVLCHNDLHEGNVLVDRNGTVTGVVDVENMIAADPLMDLAKTQQYDLDDCATKRAGLLDGYGPLPATGEARVATYRLYHALELWDWFASIGDHDPLPEIVDDMRTLACG